MTGEGKGEQEENVGSPKPLTPWLGQPGKQAQLASAATLAAKYGMHAVQMA
jgi:hypothetical protein